MGYSPKYLSTFSFRKSESRKLAERECESGVGHDTTLWTDRPGLDSGDSGLFSFSFSFFKAILSLELVKPNFVTLFVVSFFLGNYSPPNKRNDKAMLSIDYGLVPFKVFVHR